MRWIAFAAAVVLAGVAWATPRESVTFTSVNSDGPPGDVSNAVRTATLVGGYPVGRVRLSGMVTAVSTSTYESEVRIRITSPAGASTDIQVSNATNYTIDTFTDQLHILDAVFPAATTAGQWTIRFYETFNDPGVDAAWSTITITLDDGPAATDRFLEGTDAGNLPPSAGAVSAGTGLLTIIRGTLSDDVQGNGDEDMFKIRICDAAHFSASTVNGTDIDTRLYLFNQGGYGVVFDEDFDDGLQYHLQSLITAPVGLVNGVYYLAVAPYDHTALDSAGNRIWMAQPLDVQRRPDGPGALNPINHWSHTAGDSGPYAIFLTGACFVPPGRNCGTADFDGDGDVGTDRDIEAFFRCLAGTCCPTCFVLGADFDDDEDVGTDRDIEAFFRVLGGEPLLREREAEELAQRIHLRTKPRTLCRTLTARQALACC